MFPRVWWEQLVWYYLVALGHPLVNWIYRNCIEEKLRQLCRLARGDRRDHHSLDPRLYDADRCLA